MPLTEPDIIALIRCEFVDEDMRKQYEPYWIRHLGGELILTEHKAEAFVTDETTAQRHACSLNNSGERCQISVQNHEGRILTYKVRYVVIKYQQMQ